MTYTYNSKILYSQTSISFYVVVYFQYHKHLVLIYLFIFSTSFSHQGMFGTNKFNKIYRLINNYEKTAAYMIEVIKLLKRKFNWKVNFSLFQIQFLYGKLRVHTTFPGEKLSTLSKFQAPSQKIQKWKC